MSFAPVADRYMQVAQVCYQSVARVLPVLFFCLLSAFGIHVEVRVQCADRARFGCRTASRCANQGQRNEGQFAIAFEQA